VLKFRLRHYPVNMNHVLLKLHGTEGQNKRSTQLHPKSLHKKATNTVYLGCLRWPGLEPTRHVTQTTHKSSCGQNKLLKEQCHSQCTSLYGILSPNAPFLRIHTSDKSNSSIHPSRLRRRQDRHPPCVCSHILTMVRSARTPRLGNMIIMQSSKPIPPPPDRPIKVNKTGNDGRLSFCRRVIEKHKENVAY
jgi:hypothetical protein